MLAGGEIILMPNARVFPRGLKWGPLQWLGSFKRARTNDQAHPAREGQISEFIAALPHSCNLHHGRQRRKHFPYWIAAGIQQLGFKIEIKIFPKAKAVQKFNWDV